MYQVCLSISSQFEHWLPSLCELNEILKQCDGVYSCMQNQDRMYLRFSCPDACKLKVEKAIKEYLCEIYLTKVKKEYMQQNIKINLDIFDILLSILVSFDRESEKELLDRTLIVHDTMSIDGYFNFRLYEIRDRWLDICKLAKENALFLTDRETMFELLRFLMSTIKPKIEKIVVKQFNSIFEVYTLDDQLLIQLDNPEDLLLYFIETAPLEIRIVGDILPKQQRLILDSIFDDKLKA